MHKSGAVLSFLVGTLLSSCQTVPISSGTFTGGTTPGEIVHSYSRFTFPQRIGVFQRERTMEYDSTGRNVSVGYNAGVIVAATVYVYPGSRDRPIVDEFNAAKRDILTGHPNVSSLEESNLTVHGSRGRKGTFAFDETFAGATQRVKSQLYVFRHGRNFVKYRISYPLDRGERAEAEIRAFIASFHWPQDA